MLKLERVTANVGAIVHGVDLHERHGDEVSAALRQSLHSHGVLFFLADSRVSDDDFRALAVLFGDVYDYPYAWNKPRSDDRLVGVIGYKEREWPLERPERTAATYWHTDGSSQEVPPQVALLTPERLPSVGGDTMWASMPAAYDALSSHYQRMLDGMEALHTTAHTRRHFPKPEEHRAMFGDGPGERCVHPVVITDPVTRRKMLYVNSNYTERIVGMNDDESTRLLEMLFDHINTPEFHVRLRWQPGTVVVWEERVTQHRGIADYTELRTLRRITLEGEPLAA